MNSSELGGEAPCLAHLFDDVAEPVGDVSPGGQGLIVDLGSAGSGSGGAIWSLPHGGDLDANLVRLDPDATIGHHRNNDVDVLIIVHSGTGEITINDITRNVSSGHLALIPRMASRSVKAGPEGINYLSVHRRRSPLTITKTSETKTPEATPMPDRLGKDTEA